MGRSRRVLSIAAIVVGCGALVTPSVPAAHAAQRYLDPMFDVDVRRDVLYGTALAPDGSGTVVQLTLDLYTPRGDVAVDRAVFIYAHGGFFLFGDKADGDPVGWATRMAQRGYVAASINYRLGPALVTPPVDDADRVQINRARFDMQTAVRWFRANASSLAIDPDRIGVGGTSAGAVTALGVALDANAPDAIPHIAGPFGEFSSSVCGAVSISGANDPMAADAGDAGAILHHGTEDGIVPYDLAVVTRNAMIQAGLPVEWHEYAGEGHSNTFSPATVATIRSSSIQWLYDHVATAKYPCSAAVAARVRVPAGQQTVISGLPGRSAVVSLFAVESTAAGYLQVLPCGGVPGGTANLNVDGAGQTRGTIAIVKFDAAGRACIYNQSRMHLVADLQGYFAPGAFDDVADVRLSDTRTGARPVGGSQTRITGRPDSTAVLAIVATETAGAGYVQALPCGAANGAYANLNTDRAGQTRSGLAFVRFDSTGSACIFVQTSTHLVVDLQGYMAPGAFDDIADVRQFDTRSGPRPAAFELRPITGPRDRTMVMTLVATETVGPGYLQALSCTELPGAYANLYADGPDQIVSGLAFVRIPAVGNMCLYNHMSTDEVADLQGYMAPTAFDDLPDVRLLDTRVK